MRPGDPLCVHALEAPARHAAVRRRSPAFPRRGSAARSRRARASGSAARRAAPRAGRGRSSRARARTAGRSSPGGSSRQRLVPGVGERLCAACEPASQLRARTSPMTPTSESVPQMRLPVEPPEDVARALRASSGARDVEPKLVADSARLERAEDGSGIGDRSFGCERELGLGPIGVERLLDLRPLIGGSHRRISIMAARWRPSRSEPNPGGEASPRKCCAASSARCS